MNQVQKGGLVMSTDGPFLDWHCLSKLNGPQYSAEVAGCGVRGLAIVVKNDDKYWCDYITGQLYDTETLKCLSSDSLFIVDHPVKTGRKIPQIKSAKRGQPSTALH